MWHVLPVRQREELCAAADSGMADTGGASAKAPGFDGGADKVIAAGRTSEAIESLCCLPPSAQVTCLTGGIFQEPLMIEGFFSFGQYSRIIRTKSPDGAGSQLDSLSFPGESFWM